MPITVNENGVLHELEKITVNKGGVLHELGTVHANEGGVLYEIHGGFPRSLTWTADASKDSAAKIHSVSADGMTVTYTADSRNWQSTTNIAVYSNYVRLPAGAKITAEFTNATGTGNFKHYGIMTEKNGVLVGDEANRDINIAETGLYRLILRAHSVTGGQSGTSYFSCTVTAKITITK